jgi:hypothetical protein
MGRIVIIPNEIKVVQHNLALLKDETNGVLLYKRNGDICNVSTLLMTGSGNPGHVISDPNRIALVNELLKRDIGLRFVKWHTHTPETVRLFGETFLKHFSTGDTDSYKEQLRQDRDFIGMLVTPETELLCGMDNPTLSYIPMSPEIKTESERLQSIYVQCQREMGVELQNLAGRR